jgi:hypothetical protein
VEEVAADPDVEDLEVGAYVDADVAGTRLRTLAVEQVMGDVAPAMIDGRPAQGSDEIVLAPDVVPDVGLGERVAFALGDRETEVEVVGRASLPEVDVLVDFRTVTALTPDATHQLVIVELDPGADVDAFAERATEALGLLSTNVATPELPQDLANFGRADATPTVIAVLMGLVAAATLLHALMIAVQRGGRTLGILRTLGFTARQLVLTVTWQGVFLVLAAFVLSLPLAIALGRWIWFTFADDLGVVAVTSVPVVALALAAVGALLAGVLVSGWPGWRAARVAPAGVLRGD